MELIPRTVTRETQYLGILNLVHLLERFEIGVTTMDNEWDIMPAGRVKNSTFSGLFKNGNRTGIIRIGWNWDGGIFEDSGPGAAAAIKFLRSGVSSGISVFQRLPVRYIYSTYNIFDPEVNTLVSHRNGIIWAGMEKFHGIHKT